MICCCCCCSLSLSLFLSTWLAGQSASWSAGPQDVLRLIGGQISSESRYNKRDETKCVLPAISYRDLFVVHRARARALAVSLTMGAVFTCERSRGEWATLASRPPSSGPPTTTTFGRPLLIWHACPASLRGPFCVWLMRFPAASWQARKQRLWPATRHFRPAPALSASQ